MHERNLLREKRKPWSKKNQGLREGKKEKVGEDKGKQMDRVSQCYSRFKTLFVLKD